MDFERDCLTQGDQPLCDRCTRAGCRYPKFDVLQPGGLAQMGYRVLFFAVHGHGAFKIAAVGPCTAMTPELFKAMCSGLYRML